MSFHRPSQIVAAELIRTVSLALALGDMAAARDAIRAFEEERRVRASA